MSRLNQILIIILVIQVGVAAFAFWPKSTAQAGDNPILPNFTAANVVKLTISDGDDNTVVLAKNGDSWVLPEAGDFPVEAEKVSALLDKIAAIKTNRLVTQTETSHRRLQVAADDFARLVELESGDGSTHKLYIGSTAGAGATHVRLDGQSNVYLSADLTSFEANAQPSGWIDTLYFEVPRENVVGLTLENENGTFEFEKEGESWTMAGLADDEAFNETGLTGMLTGITSVRLAAPLGKEEKAEYGLDNPLAVVALKTSGEEGDKTYTLTVGAKNDTGYIFHSSESPYYVQISEFVGNSLVEKTRDDFLQAPPTEESTTPTGTSE